MGLAAVDLGKIEKGSKTKFGVVIYNEGNEHTHLETWASCGCTKPVIEPNVVPPGGTAIMTVVFDSTGKSGIQEKKFGLNYKHDNVAYGVTLTLKAKI
jgi:hypothetical protein